MGTPRLRAVVLLGCIGYGLALSLGSLVAGCLYLLYLLGRAIVSLFADV
jgi:hypothetical protein